MPVTRTEANVFYGYADVYYANENEAIPASTGTLAAPGAGYTGIGFTAEGVMTELAKDLEDITVEEQLTPVDTVVTGVQFTVSLIVAEDIIENRQLAYGLGTLTTTAAASGQIGKKTLVLGETLAKKAILVDVANKYGFTTRIHVPSVASTGSVGTPYRRAEKRVYPIEFRAMCAPGQITIIEQTAAAV